MATKYCVGLLILTVLGCTVLLVIVAVVLSLILTDTGQDSTEGNYSFLKHISYNMQSTRYYLCLVPIDLDI